MNKQKALDSIPAAPPSSHPNSEVVAQAQRRRFSPEYELRVLTEADQAKGAGGVGALLCREGLYSSLLNDCAAKINASPRSCAKPESSSISKKWPHSLG